MTRKYKAVYTCIPSPYYCPFRAREIEDGMCTNVWRCQKTEYICYRSDMFPDWCPLDDFDEEKGSFDI